MIKRESTAVVAAILFILGVSTLTPCPNACTCRFNAVTCKNASLTSIPSDISKDTTHLSVCYNSITSLYKTDLTGLLKLTVISMNDNAIETIDPEAFHELKKLRRLYLNNNRITRLHYQTFRWAKSLRYLFLQNNRIHYIDPGLFTFVMKLKVLDISRNYLKTLEENTFQNNRMLSWVNVRNNIHIDAVNWKTVLKHSFDFSDIQFCEENDNVLNIKMGASKHKEDNEESTHKNYSLNKHKQTLETDGNLITRYLFIKPKHASFDEYDTFVRTVGYDEYSTVIIRGNYTTTFLTDYPIFCYCKGQILWFWCHEIEAKCSNNTSVLVMSTVLQCNSHVSTEILSPIALPDSGTSRLSEDFANVDKTGGSNTNTVNLVICAWIAAGLITLKVM